ncbi:MAG TPA: tetratricopeptide repeat protein [Paraburkholderia sp.]|jgi:tetratricopeptide (TPR) repeat protein|nr:tetratricopeptide repeat protein [Paraburkholderia sp.]
MSKKTLPPRQIEALLQQAVALQQNGALAEAEEMYRELLAARPRHFDALQLLGALMLQQGRLEEGAAQLQRALEIDAKQPALHSNLSYALNALQRPTEALASANRALALQPRFADALNNHGTALASLERPHDALTSFDKALEVAPQMASAWNNRACTLRDLNRPQDALASCERAIELQPAYAQAWSNRANALSDLDHAADARASYLQALQIAPDFADAWNNLGLTLIDLGEHAAALAAFERALELNPNDVECRWNRSNCLLRMGRLAEGWPEYEVRWQRRWIGARPRAFAQPLWLGDFPLEGKTILLHAEQGLGDTLQFCRYATQVARLGATVLLEVPAPLTRLLQNLEGVGQVIEEGAPLPDFDCHCPLLSLPLALRTTVESIPAAASYLQASPADLARWTQRIGPREPGSLRVGLVWAGGDRPHVPELRRTDRRRSLRLETFAPLLNLPQVRFYSVQKGEAAQQAVSLNAQLSAAQQIIDFTDDIADFADTAALIEQLDLLISVDTSTAHLAGALGKPVWIANRVDTCWRWLLERDDSPWYRSATLFRQQRLGQWDDVIEALADALAKHAQAFTQQ